MSTLEKIGINVHIRRFIQQLYWNQTAVVRSENAESEEISIEKGVRQGCVLSPILFNIYLEVIFHQAIKNDKDGIKVDNERISNIYDTRMTLS